MISNVHYGSSNGAGPIVFHRCRFRCSRAAAWMYIRCMVCIRAVQCGGRVFSTTNHGEK